MNNISKTSNPQLRLIKPDFDSPVTDLVIDLEKLRDKVMSGTTDFYVFIQIKTLFHTLESIGSARIEGNNTTISDYLEAKLAGKDAKPTASYKPERQEKIKEIQNIEDAIKFIELSVNDSPINHAFIRELHKIVVGELSFSNGGEGDKTPGAYRKSDVGIQGSDLKPVSWLKVDEYMDELVEFINQESIPKYDLLKVAIVHHRFLWIHPFRNGNGRTARLITYAMLVKYGFKVNSARILNPTAIFCNDRQAYYDKLSVADSHSDDGILKWCEYVLDGLRTEIQKVDKLADYNFLKKAILIPAIEYAFEKEFLREIELKILRVVIEKQYLVANDIKGLFHNKWNSEISRQIKILTEKNLLEPVEEKSRKYRLRIFNKYLINEIIHFLGENDFLPTRQDIIEIKKGV